MFCIYFKLFTRIIRVFSSFRTLLQYLCQRSGLFSPSILTVSVFLCLNGGFVFSLYEIQQDLSNCAVMIISRRDERSSGSALVFFSYGIQDFL
jgi:hypothetical protein